jgi:hypothetical protein
MSFFIGDPAVHNTPFAVLAQEEAELRAEAAAIRRAFGQLAREILLLVINAILRAMGLGAFAGPLDGAITALENALVDIPKGNIHGLVTNLGALATSIQQIIDTTLNGLGFPGAGHAVDELFGAFKVIADLIADFEKALQIAGVSTPTGLIHELRGLLPAALPQFNGTAQAASIPGFVNNGNGTISYTAQEGIDAVSHLIQQADGTVVTAAHAAQQAVVAATAGGAPNIGQAVAAAQQVVDHGIAALDGGIMQIAQPAQGFAGALTRHLTGLFNGWTGSSVAAANAPDVSIAAQQAAAAAAIQAQQTAAINSQLPHFYGGTGANGNNYSLPLAAIPAAGFTLTNGVELYGSQLLTDSQTVSALWNKVLAWTAGVSEVRTVFLRSNVGATTYCYAKMSLSGDPGSTYFSQTAYGNSYTVNDPNAKFVVEIGCYVAGVKTVLQTWSYPLWTFWINNNGTNLYFRNTGYTYYLNSANHVFAFEVTSYAFEVDFSGLALTVTDTSPVSQKGASYLSGGFSESVTDASLNMSWDFYDSGPVSGPATAYVATQESQVSIATYGDLATTTDQVTVNVGASGMLLVNIYAGAVTVNLTGGVGLMSFALSGANTQAATDAYSAAFQVYTNGAYGQANGFFLITGLSQGATTVKAKYRSYATGYSSTWQHRRVTAIPL